MPTNTKLDALTKTLTAFSTFAELVEAGLRGYAPTFSRAPLAPAALGAAFDARMIFEGATPRTFWRD